MLPIELERVLCFGPRKLTMVWGPKGVASTVYIYMYIYID